MDVNKLNYFELYIEITDSVLILQNVYSHQSCDLDVCSPTDFSVNCRKCLLFAQFKSFGCIQTKTEQFFCSGHSGSILKWL